MIDGLFKQKIDIFWNLVARLLVKLKFTANLVSILGLILVVINCLLYLYHKNNLIFGLALVVAFSFDALDGAVARITDTQSLYGGYLDAVIDRYQEIFIFLVIAIVNDYWVICFLATTGSLLVSYNKARTAIEIQINNLEWPDLAERFERIILICAGLILDPFFSNTWLFNNGFLFNIILLLAILSHITAIQRFYRARKLLLK